MAMDITKGSTRVYIDPKRCIANAKCTTAAPGVFVLDDETGVAVIENPADATVEQLFAGARACPTQAIIIEQFGRRVYPTILSPMFGAGKEEVKSGDEQIVECLGLASATQEVNGSELLAVLINQPDQWSSCRDGAGQRGSRFQPLGSGSATIDNQELPLPDGPVPRFAVIGDTGWRTNDWEKKYQACNGPGARPFAQVAQAVAHRHLDLIVHVGNYLYRQRTCPVGMAGCQGSLHGDNWVTGDADFFTPHASILGAAPRVSMRGNHETCDRNPVGWIALFAPWPYQPTCHELAEPYVTTPHGLPVAVIKSAEAAETSDSPEQTAEYIRQFWLLAEISPPGSWLVTHRLVWGFLEGAKGKFEVENATYASATGDTLKAVYAAETLLTFGFMTIEPDGDAWIAAQRHKQGDRLLACALDLAQMSCGAPAAG